MSKVVRCEAVVVTSQVSPSFDLLTQEMLDRGLYLRCKISGWSMYPFIQNSDILLIEPRSSAKLNIGDIIIFRRLCGSYVMYVVHRLIKKNGSSTLITKGDDLRYYDEPVPIEQVMGRVIQIEGRGKRLRLESQSRRILNWLIAWLARSSNPTCTRMKRILDKLYWLLLGRRMK